MSLPEEAETPTPTMAEPTEPGFYVYTEGRQLLVFLLLLGGQWCVFNDNGSAAHCQWAYIEQAIQSPDGLVRLDEAMEYYVS